MQILKDTISRAHMADKSHLHEDLTMTSTAALSPALTEWNGTHGLPRFDAIRDEDFAGAFDAALAAHNAEIDDIAGDAAQPSFVNTIVALEIAGDALSRVSALFWNKAGAHTNPAHPPKVPLGLSLSL